MSPIKAFGLSNLTPDLLIQYVRGIITITTPLNSDLTFKALRAQLIALIDELNSALQRVLTSEHTATLETLDYDRDQLIAVLDKYLDFAVTASMLDKTRADQAAIVLAVRKNYSARLANLSYQAETAQLTAMLTALETVAGASEESLAQPIISALAVANRKFQTAFDAKISDTGSEEKVRLTRSIRVDMNEAYGKLVGYITVVGSINPAAFTTVSSSINTLIDEFSAQADAIKTRGETAKEKAIQAVQGRAI